MRELSAASSARDMRSAGSAIGGNVAARRDDPIPKGGLVEKTYCRLYAMTGRWEPVFLEIVKRAYGVDAVPQRFHDTAMRMKLEIQQERRIRDAIAACECGCNV